METVNSSLVSIVIVIGRKDYIRPCIDSLKVQSYANLEIIVIDNSLDEDFAREIINDYPFVVLYRSLLNLFYCASLNQGISMSKGDFVLCLNDDTILDKRFIEEAIAGFSVSQRIGLVSAKIMRQDGVHIDSSGLYVGLGRTAKERGYGIKDRGQYNARGYIFGANGAVAFYRREMLDDIKQGSDYFDPDFRFFYEDLDIAWRAQNKGWEGYYVPTAIAYHARGGTARKEKGVGKSFARFYINDNLQFELIKNRWLTIIKNDTALGFLVHLPFIFIYDLAEFVFLLIFRPKVIPKLSGFPRYIRSAFRKRIAAKRV